MRGRYTLNLVWSYWDKQSFWRVVGPVRPEVGMLIEIEMHGREVHLEILEIKWIGGPRTCWVRVELRYAGPKDGDGPQ